MFMKCTVKCLASASLGKTLETKHKGMETADSNCENYASEEETCAPP